MIVSRNRMAAILAGVALTSRVGLTEGAVDDPPRGEPHNAGRNEAKRRAAELNGGRKRKHRLRAERAKP
jgi:hypothetical protein